MSQSSLVASARSRSVPALAALALLTAAFTACLSRPSIPVPDPEPEEPSDGPIWPRVPPRDPVSLIPAAPLDAAPPVIWIRVEGPVDPARIVLVHGRAGSAQLGQVRRNEISRILRATLVPVVIWSEEPQESSGALGDGASQNGSVVIAPSEALVPGEDYTLISGEPERVTTIRVVAGDPAPIVGRMWPLAGASATSRYAVWCSDMPLPPIDEAVSLAPAGPAGRILRGVF